MRLKAAAIATLLATAAACTAQETIDVSLRTPLSLVCLGAGGAKPVAAASTQSPTGEALSNLQPASYAEWKVNCQTPGLYRIGVLLAQWQNPGTVLAFETRAFSDPEDPYATRYATPDTRDYGQTLAPDLYMGLGDLEDAAGNTLLVPLMAGDNVLRVQNVTGRHNPAESVPTDLRDTRAREWDFFYSGVNIALIRLTRASDLPATATLTGTVTGDRPQTMPVRGALVLANPPGGSPPEPSHFWKSGYYTFTRDDGTYSLTVPAGDWDVKAGRSGSYRIQGSEVAPASLEAGASATADLALTSLFHTDDQGRQVAEVQMVYADRFVGDVSILPQSGENGLKVGWFHQGDQLSVLVDAPRAGNYSVVVAYLNGGAAGVGRLTTQTGQSITGSHPVTSWETVGRAAYSAPLALSQGTNVITQSLVSGDTDPNAIYLIAPPVTLADALTALRVAAGLQAATSAEAWMGTIAGDAAIAIEDAARILQASNGRPL